MSHISTLDSLRGFAALMVCGAHYLQHVGGDLYFPAHQAVLLFFVLSGYVLSLSLDKNHYTYIGYLIRRIFRIYPAYLFAIIIATFFVMGLTVINLEYILHWGLLITDIGNIFSKIKMLDRPQIGHPIDSVTWSLTYEMLISIIFPFLYWFFFQLRRKFRNILMIFYMVLSWSLFQKFQTGLLSIMYYSGYFVIGMLLVSNMPLTKRFSSFWFLGLGVICFFNNCLTSNLNFTIYNIYFLDLLSSIGACLLIIACVYNAHVIRVMSNQIIHFYGNISYSFYLIHGPVLWILIKYFPTDMIVYTLIFSFIISTLLSYFSYFCIEKPFVKIGTLIIAKIK